jgi:hypothetical protein
VSSGVEDRASNLGLESDWPHDLEELRKKMRMFIKSIKNHTDKQIELWDRKTCLTALPPGATENNLPMTITSVTHEEVRYHNTVGALSEGDSYLVTFVSGSSPFVVFAGSTGNVLFS